MIQTLILLMLLAGPPESTLSVGPQGPLLAWLMRTGRMKERIDTDRLDRILRRGEAIYLDGGSRSAAALFGSLLLDPSFWELSKTPTHDNLRYDLAGAMIAEGAYGRAREILLELVSRTPPGAFRAPAFRKLTDLTLGSGQYEQSLIALDALPKNLGDDEKDEVAYMKGLALAGMGYPQQAQEALAHVSRHSRFRAPATYLMGVLSLEQENSDEATRHFCSIVRQPARGKYTFFVSGNTLEVIDRAWLALARIRHDEGQYQRAIETYEKIARGSRVEFEARYESAWSLFRANRFSEARTRIEGLIDENPLMVDFPAAFLLLGYSLAGDCFFDQAKEVFAGLEEQLVSPIEDREMGPGINLPVLPTPVRSAVPPTRAEVSALRASENIREAAQRARWLLEQLGRVASGMPQKFRPLPGERLCEDLQADLSRARSLSQRLADLRFHRGKQDPPQHRELDQLLAQVVAAQARAQDALKKLSLGQAGGQPVQSTLVTDQDLPKAYLFVEQKESADLFRTLIEQQDASNRMAATAQRTWAHRSSGKVSGWARLAAIGKIDAVIGQKQALETEVQNLAQGRYPLSLFKELAEAGFVDESMEYWPYDGEAWPDEIQ
jgi:tetratricopeptide (TPR) repeat protein